MCPWFALSSVSAPLRGVALGYRRKDEGGDVLLHGQPISEPRFASMLYNVMICKSYTGVTLTIIGLVRIQFAFNRTYTNLYQIEL